MLAYYYPQGRQRCIVGLTETDNYNIWEVHVRPRRGARRGFATTERALHVSVSAKTDDHKFGFSAERKGRRTKQHTGICPDFKGL